ncbi:unnamed protein product [Cutaneotrichosporon oleaginosum]
MTSTALATPVSTAARTSLSVSLPAWANNTPSAGPVSVSIEHDGSNITITGRREAGLDVFLGIPYAEPPTGPLRFARPQAKRYNSSVLATAAGPACMQPTEGVSLSTSEDCLTLNIMAPAGVRSRLPVIVWIHGGGFVRGSGAEALSPSFVSYGARTARPFIFVTLNYRLGAFGFAHDNAGLRDQKLALQWVRAHIHALGGDPAKVVAWGHSAGAASIGLLMLSRQKLFRGAILQSGAPGLVPVRPRHMVRRTVRRLARLAGCKRDEIACLRNLTADGVLDAAARLKALPEYARLAEWAPARDEIVPASPLAALRRVKIPFICGTTRDEGTFMLRSAMIAASGSSHASADHASMNGANASLLSAAEYLAAAWALPRDVISEVLAAYPDDPALGAPFGTGNETFGLPTQYKQVAAIITDGQWTSRRRALLGANRKAWGYVFAAGPPASASHPAYLGASHTDDMPYLFGGVNATVYGPEDLDLAQKMLNYWTNFAYHLDPNGADKRGEGNAALSTFWETYDEGRIMNLSAGGTWMEPDDARWDQVQVFRRPAVAKAMYWLIGDRSDSRSTDV